MAGGALGKRVGPLPDGWLGLAFSPKGDRVYAGGGLRGRRICSGVWSCNSSRCKLLFFNGLRRRFEIGRRIWKAFFARCVSRTVRGSMVRVPLCKCLNFNAIRLPTGAGMGLGWHPAAIAVPDAAPNGEALVWVVVVGLGFPVVEDSVEGAGGGVGRNEAKWAAPRLGRSGTCPTRDTERSQIRIVTKRIPPCPQLTMPRQGQIRK
jgi:hypothetical protein